MKVEHPAIDYPIFRSMTRFRSSRRTPTVIDPPIQGASSMKSTAITAAPILGSSLAVNNKQTPEGIPLTMHHDCAGGSAKNRSRLLALLLFTGCSGAVVADCGVAASYLNNTQLSTILSGNYACGQSTSLNPPGWNELHGPGTTLTEQHQIGDNTDDENVGAWSTVNASGRGRVTYAYSGGLTPVYEVAVLGPTCSGPSCIALPQTYRLCGVGGGAPASLTILVTASATPLTGCPSNP